MGLPWQLLETFRETKAYHHNNQSHRLLLTMNILDSLTMKLLSILLSITVMQHQVQSAIFHRGTQQIVEDDDDDEDDEDFEEDEDDDEDDDDDDEEDDDEEDDEDDDEDDF